MTEIKKNRQDGSPSYEGENHAAVLHVLGGIDKDLLLADQDDKLGRQMQDNDGLKQNTFNYYEPYLRMLNGVHFI